MCRSGMAVSHGLGAILGLKIVVALGVLHATLVVCNAKAIKTVNVPQDAPIGHFITDINTSCTIEATQTEFYNLFDHSSTGALVTKNYLTDISDENISLVVKNSESVTELLINILPTRSLIFRQQMYIGTIRENEPAETLVAVIGHLCVVGASKNVSYSIVSGDSRLFQLEYLRYGRVHDNKVRTMAALDREQRGVYSLVIQAQSQDGFTARAQLDVHVVDVNDNIPRFDKSVVHITTTTIQECNTIITVHALDTDSNDEITYTAEGSADFIIDSTSGEVFSESDYLFPGTYNLIVNAIDSAGHKSNNLVIHIKVEDDTLKFQPTSEIHHISKRATTTIKKVYEIVENSTSMASLFSVATITPRPQSSTETYKLIFASVDMFQQPDVNGNVYLKPGKRLDFEDLNQRQVTLKFNRSNIIEPEDVTVVEVTLRVQDKNDEKPWFVNRPRPYLAAMSTNPGVGQTVYTLYAEDPDQNARLSYNLESGGEGKFQVLTETDPESGDLVGKIVTTVSGAGHFLDGMEYTLVMSAQDDAAGTSPPQKSNFALVKVLVGFRPPQLFENPYRAKVYENSGTGYKIQSLDDTILVVKAKCFQDQAENKVTFDLTDTSGRISGMFSINNRGIVETLQNLDFEEPPNQYQLNITATELDTGLSSSTQLLVDVLDVNDNQPKFTYSTYTFYLGEDTQEGGPALPLLVTAKDRDSGVNAQLVYSVNDDHFSIETIAQGNQYIGRIKVAKHLDYDHRPDHQYRFNVTAIDLGELPKHGLATVIVYVRNVNDEAPVFGSGVDHLYASISEEQTVGSVVTIIQASDPDGDNIKYYFTPRSTFSRPFKIDPDSGLITLTQRLPESVPFYTLNITAYDDGSCCPVARSLSSQTYIIVEIKDTNNNQPKFLDCSYEPTVLEKQPVGTPVVKVKAVDNDRGANGNITYSIVTSPRQKKQFDVDPITGQVVTAVIFNREASGADRGVSVTVNAADHGTPQSLDSHCTFWVRIGDINDNPPKFDSPSYVTSVSESSAIIGRRVFAVRATDEDEGRNAKVVYTLVDNPGGFYRIERDTGIIYWETGLFGVNEVNLMVKAEDGGIPPLSTLGSVHISITDRANHPPTWDDDSYEREYLIKETAPIGYTVAVMRASPNNPAPLDEVTFALIDSLDNTVQDLGPFRIRQEGDTVKLLVSDTMNYKVKNRYELRLRVTNQANTPLSAEIRPVIVIKDMNNEGPRFEGLDLALSNSYRSSVPENEPPGQTVMTVKAVDEDHEPPNNLVSYSLLEDKNGAFRHFRINSTSGVITTMSQFDREEQSVYYIKLMAADGKDSDSPWHDPPNTPNSATAQVQVIIADKNDNYPYFTQSHWAISVQEQRPDTTGRILTVTARDMDEVDSLAYSIWKGNVGNVFGMKRKTGEIYVAKTLDYETPPTSYTLLVNVSDGLYQNTTTVVVNVTDVNDNEPEFNQELYEITDVIEETDPPLGGKFLVQVFATDKDVSRPSQFRFSLSGDGTSLADPTFTIESNTGRIFLRKKLDRDLPNGRDVYQFNVIAEDEPDTQGALFGYAYVKVMPEDINDNDPVFNGADLQGKVAEHSPAGQSVMTVVATDFDAGPNGTVFYEIDRFGNPPAVAGTGEWLFQINSETGLITTKIDNSLDRETTAQYFLQIVAKDRGIEQRSATATVTISISDINDQIPKFVEKVYRVSMSENQGSGPVITVSATDNDIDEHARLTYTLKRSDRTYFSIRSIPPNAGVLTVYQPIDFEKIEFFNLTVYVQDSDPSHKDEAHIEVTVVDYNDNAPQFHPKVKTSRLPENIPDGTSLWNCSASDQDSGINAHFTYSIDRSTDEGHRFTVNSLCEVKIQRGLDGETLDREALHGLPEEKYEVHILATDKGYPRQTGTAVLRIFVDDKNDNVPEFKLPHPAIVMEGEAPPKHVVTFSATDRDTAKYGAPFLFSLPPCEDNPTCVNGDLTFTMEFDPNGDNKNGTGIVTAQKTFWRDQQKFYYLPVIMSDMRGRGSPYSITGTNTLTIEIGDINNQPHKSGHKDIFVYKYDFKGVAEGLVIGTVYAEDPDDWDVKDKHFYFQGPPVMANYFSVDFNDGSIYMNEKTPAGVHQFVAKVWDFRVFTKINATCTVTVTVEEITDEAIYRSGSLRITGITAEEFVMTPLDKPAGMSKYTLFQKAMAEKLSVPRVNVQIFSVMNGEGLYTDIRYAVHGSPYRQPDKLNGIVSLDKYEFEQTAGITISMININMCLREMCESGGCSNLLVIGDNPNYVNTNGTSFVGVSTSVQADCQCRAKNFSAAPACTPDYCYNGGQCVRDDWGDVRCINCPASFDGPRCQKTRQSFNGGYGLFSPFEQCEESTTSIDILAKKSSGLVFYNGPVAELGMGDPMDYIALWLEDGYPVLQIDHGSGSLTLKLDGRDKKGNRPLQKLDDGRWHHIDIIRKAKVVTMVVDRCEVTNGDSTADSSTDRSPCEVHGETPGDNFYLNVNTMLQLGGRYVEPTYPDTVTSARFRGCVRNLVHNGQLYDLYAGQYSSGENPMDGCPDEDRVCGSVNSIGGVKCGPHGRCEATDINNDLYSCTCLPGWRTSGPSAENCNTQTTVRDMQESSFMSWSLRYEFLNTEVKSSTNQVQLNFRTRDPTGILFHLPSNNDEFITLELVDGRVQVVYNLGDTAAGGSVDRVLTLAHAPASNGQWHTLYLRRIGRWFQLRMDGGEGRYYNETWGASNGNQHFTLRMNQIVAGAHVVFSKNPIAAGQDLSSTCVNDVRLNNEWLPMQNSENDLSYAALLEYERNVVMDCTRDDCLLVNCPSGVPYSMLCHALWDDYECRCPPGTYPDHHNCFPIDYCFVDQPCFDGALCITKPYPTNFTCVCPMGWTGRLCNMLSAAEIASAGITTGFIVIIIVCIFVVLVTALLVFLVIRYKKDKDPEKYILDPDDDDDIRENVMNYNEEGAGEEDQDAYDINRLRKPDGVDIGSHAFEPLIFDRRQGRTPTGERPDVATFIVDRLNEANYDSAAPPHDSVREFVYEGGGSDAGSLSSLQTSSSQDDQDYDYLNDWGPKFSKLATMYGGEDDDL